MIIGLPVESTHCPQSSKILSLSFISALAFSLVCPLSLLPLCNLLSIPN